MGNKRPEQPNPARAAHELAETNKGAAASAASVPELRLVVAENSTAVQSNATAIQRLEALFYADFRERNGGA